MSMSQEEIESLMNGLDFEDEPASEESPVEESAPEGNMSEDDINDLIAQTEDIAVNNEEDNSSSEESVDDLLNSLEDIEPSVDETQEDSETNIDDILKELEQSDSVEEESTLDASDELLDLDIGLDTVEEEASVIGEDVSASLDESSSDDIDELLSTIDGMKEEPELVENDVVEEIKEEEPVVKTEELNNDTSINHKISDDLGKDWTDNKIQEGIFPLPVEDDTKVVNQLSEVASDSEEKATKIFDVLSNILDYNNGIQSDVQALSSFNEKQVAMLTSLSKKFPNIDVFKENLTQAEAMGIHISDINDKLDNGNTEIFQAMELMQYHDINRQKIERVMSVIRKLSTYLNNLFEDEGNREEVVVANHIHGDNTEDLLENEDLEALIAEFND